MSLDSRRRRPESDRQSLPHHLVLVSGGKEHHSEAITNIEYRRRLQQPVPVSAKPRGQPSTFKIGDLTLIGVSRYQLGLSKISKMVYFEKGQKVATSVFLRLACSSIS